MLNLKSRFLNNLNLIIFKYIFIFFIAFVALLFRNIDSWMNPILYTEDAQWLGMAFTKGWLYTFLHAKEGYFVWLNLILLGISEKISYLVSGSEILYLPYTISCISFSFFAFVATFSFIATKTILNIYFRWILFFVIIFLPMGNSSNEILGRISNIGYYIVFLTTLLLYMRINTISYYKIIIIDFYLFIFFGTNPVTFILVGLYLVYEFFYRFNIKLFITKNLSLIVFISIFTLLLLSFTSKGGSSITGSLNINSIIEVAIARSILYPIIFGSYYNLNDFVTIILGVLLIGFIFYAYRYSVASKDLRRIFNFTLVSFSIFYFLTLYMRQSLTQQLGEYSTTFPDRYFIGLNVLVIFIVILSFQSLLNKKRVISIFGGICIVFYYTLNLNWLIEYKDPRMNIMINESWQQTVCRAYKDEKFFKPDYIFLSAYFEGWYMKIPTTMLNNQNIKNFCVNELNQYRILKLTDFNWTNGVSKDGLILLLKNDSINSKITVFDEIDFSNTENRKIVKIEIVSDKYLYIYLDSPIFDITSQIIKIQGK